MRKGTKLIIRIRTHMSFWTPTRQAGLERLERFTPQMGKAYASGRNFDRGPGGHISVSCLSPYIRRRLVTEMEVVVSAVRHHGRKGAEKFIQEVLWRSYFKGWLERRPAVWTSYRQGLLRDLAAVEADEDLAAALERAETGHTGIECFDAWVHELIETGYLHNHARMWFASIWIFTLKLPWRIGADFFYRHLLDGDPASNTLSWRWVAGLHTRGKAYQAQAWNIAKFTGHRFNPAAETFESAPQALDGTEPDGHPAPQAPRAFRRPDIGKPTAILLTEEDCRPETLFGSSTKICAVATLATSDLRSPRPVSGPVRAFEAGALADAATRFGKDHDILIAGAGEELAAWARRAGAEQILTAHVSTGPLKDWFDAAGPAFANQGVALCEARRAWDEATWRHATAGFFKVKKEIPNILDDLAVA